MIEYIWLALPILVLLAISRMLKRRKHEHKLAKDRDRRLRRNTQKLGWTNARMKFGYFGKAKRNRWK